MLYFQEAIESAVKDGLYTDAMILARRICSNDPQELERIETAFLSHRSDQNPVMTLLSVANGQPAPVLVSLLSLFDGDIFRNYCIWQRVCRLFVGIAETWRGLHRESFYWAKETLYHMFARLGEQQSTANVISSGNGFCPMLEKVMKLR